MQKKTNVKTTVPTIPVSYRVSGAEKEASFGSEDIKGVPKNANANRNG
jgi:hypothetical protein